MSTDSETIFHLAVSPESARRLSELAGEAGAQPEEFLRASVEEWLSRPRASLAEAATSALAKHEGPASR